MAMIPMQKAEEEREWTSISGLPATVIAYTDGKFVQVAFQNVAHNADVSALPRPATYQLFPLISGTTVSGIVQCTGSTWTVKNGGYGAQMYLRYDYLASHST